MALLAERDLARWGREARAWLSRDDRRRTIGLVVLSVTISIAISLIATALVGFVAQRRAGMPGDAAPADVGEPMAEVAPASDEVVGVPVMVVEGVPAGAETA